MISRNFPRPRRDTSDPRLAQPSEESVRAAAVPPRRINDIQIPKRIRPIDDKQLEEEITKIFQREQESLVAKYEDLDTQFEEARSYLGVVAANTFHHGKTWQKKVKELIEESYEERISPEFLALAKNYRDELAKRDAKIALLERQLSELQERIVKNEKA